MNHKTDASEACCPKSECQSCCDEMRCCCGSLLARFVPGGVELKCRRCKRTILLNLMALEKAGSYTNVYRKK